jgi:hypothetical protein
VVSILDKTRAACVAAVLVAGTAATLPARAAARSWNVAQINRLTADDSIDDLSMSLQGDGWAVGSNDTNRGSHPIVQRLEGGRWTWMSTRGLGHLEPSQVAAVSSTEAWAFGGAAHGAFVARWDGARWSTHRVSKAAVTDAAALSRRNVWAVGPSAQGEPTRVAVHWNGVDWSSVRLPARATAITATSSRDAWAVGNVSADRVAVMRLHGSRWRVAHTRRVALPERDAVATLADVSASSARDVWAVGGVSWACGIDGDDQCGRSLLLHYDGHRWSFTEGRRHGGSYTGYTKVAVDGAGGAWALASQWNPRLYHLVGKRMTALRVPRPERTDMNLNSLAFRSRDNTVWAAGFVAPVGDPPDPSADGIFLAR